MVVVAGKAGTHCLLFVVAVLMVVVVVSLVKSLSVFF